MLGMNYRINLPEHAMIRRLLRSFWTNYQARACKAINDLPRALLIIGLIAEKAHLKFSWNYTNAELISL
jgi:hypothetical protein